jgi:phosphopentomutase
MAIIMTERVFIIVLDSFGCGELPDADAFGDGGSSTLRSVASSRFFRADNLTRLGLFNIDGNTVVKTPAAAPLASYGRAIEASAGKDTIIGHWEICGVISPRSLPLYPHGFPREVLDMLEHATGIGCICNLPYSGTDVIRDFGAEHIATSKVIVYTSADSVFQVAAHEKYFGLDKLYAYCKTARELLVGDHGVGRVIARPFIGETPDTFTRTSNRHDYALDPPGQTLFDVLKRVGFDTLSVGKIYDIFNGRSVDERHATKSNADGMAVTDTLAARTDWRGLCMVNLVDFDMLWGHRNDIDGYARGIAEFDGWLGGFLDRMGERDALIITADHGCDPGTPSTDHSREYIPVLCYGKSLEPHALGTFPNFTYVGGLVQKLLGLGGVV